MIQENRKTRFKAKLKANAFAYALLVPSLIILILFTFYPAIKSLYLSFFDYSLNSSEFTGVENYKAVFGNDIFWQVLKNNIILVVGTVPTSILLAMYFAIWINGKLRFNTFLRTAFFYPTIIPMIAIANIWLFIYTPDYGLLDKFLNIFNIAGPNWLGDSSWVMISLIVMLIWKETGFFMIFFLAGLQNLPTDVYEAAKIEGATPFRQFKDITFPLLAPTTLFVTIIALTNAFKMVDHLYIMTKGGPDNASNLLLYMIYETAFSFWDMGKAAVLTVVLVAILLTIAITNYVFFDKRIHY